MRCQRFYSLAIRIVVWMWDVEEVEGVGVDTPIAEMEENLVYDDRHADALNRCYMRNRRCILTRKTEHQVEHSFGGYLLIDLFRRG
jgi:hypothetical protein